MRVSLYIGLCNYLGFASRDMMGGLDGGSRIPVFNKKNGAYS